MLFTTMPLTSWEVIYKYLIVGPFLIDYLKRKKTLFHISNNLNLQGLI